MNRKSSRKNQESETATMEKVKAVRDDLERIEADIALNKKRQAEVFQGYNDSLDSDRTVIRALSYLENSGMPDSSVSFEEESRALRDQAEVLHQAHRIKSAELQPLIAQASNEHRENIMPEFIDCLKKKFEAMRLYENAWNEEKKLRLSFTSKNLRDILPPLNWPGVNPLNFRRQEENLQYSLRQMNLEHILEKH